MNRLLTILLITCFSFFSGSANAASTFVIKVLDDGQEKQSGVATLVSNEHIITNSLLIAQGNHFLVEDPKSKATLVAKLVAKDEQTNIALLQVNGLTGEVLPFSITEPEIGRSIAILKADGTSAIGTLHSFKNGDKDASANSVKHTVILNNNDFGAPLINNCKQLIGISLHAQKGLFDKRLEYAKDFTAATRLDALKLFLKNQNTSFVVAQSECLSEQKQLALLEQEKSAQAELAAQTKQQKEAAETELARIKEQKQKELEEKEKALAEIDAQRQHSEQQKEQIEAELKESELSKIEQQNELEKAKQEQQQQKQALAEADAKRIEQEEQLEEAKIAKQKERQTTMFTAIGAGIVILIIIIVAVMLMLKRKKQLSAAEAQSISNKHLLDVEQAKYTSAKEELQEALASFDDVVFVGTDKDGTEYRVKIIGDTLARAKDGVSLGRSAQAVDYLLNAPSVSRKHLILTLEDQSLFIEDLGSSNGTAINAASLVPGTKVQVKHEDKVRIGTVNGHLVIVEK